MKEESFHHAEILFHRGGKIVPPWWNDFFLDDGTIKKYAYLVLSFRYHFVLRTYVHATPWLEVMYSSYSIILSIIPFGVNSMIRLATVAMNSWSWMRKGYCPYRSLDYC